MEEYKREEKESVQYQKNLIDKTFDSMLHPIMSDQQLMQQSLHQYQRGLVDSSERPPIDNSPLLSLHKTFIKGKTKSKLNC